VAFSGVGDASLAIGIYNSRFMLSELVMKRSYAYTYTALEEISIDDELLSEWNVEDMEKERLRCPSASNSWQRSKHPSHRIFHPTSTSFKYCAVIFSNAVPSVN
jgi:hypothetical protein